MSSRESIAMHDNTVAITSLSLVAMRKEAWINLGGFGYELLLQMSNLIPLLILQSSIAI